MRQGRQGSGGISAPQTAQAGQQISITVNDGATSVVVHVQGTGHTDTAAVGSGQATVTIPRGVPSGSLVVIVSNKIPPSSQIVEVVSGN